MIGNNAMKPGALFDDKSCGTKEETTFFTRTVEKLMFIEMQYRDAIKLQNVSFKKFYQ